MTCTSTPISWLRLERHALSSDARITAHLAACPACSASFEEIRRDVVALPVLDVPARRTRRAWWTFALPAIAAAALIVAIWPRDHGREDAVRVKGVGDVVLGVIRERDGAIRDDATTFLPTDRWKVVVTCPPAASVSIEVDVNGDMPLAQTTISCGNRVVVPGAFHLTGDVPNRVCVVIDGDRACRTIRPEK